MAIPFFKHNNALRDEELVSQMRMKEGIDGYGIYVAILEMLCCNDGTLTSQDTESLSSRIGWQLNFHDYDKIKRIIEDYSLFKISKKGNGILMKSTVFSKDFEDVKKAQAQRKKWASNAAKSRWSKKSAAYVDGDSLDSEAKDAECTSKTNKRGKANSASEKQAEEDKMKHFMENIDEEWKPPLKKWVEYKEKNGQGYTSLDALSSALDSLKMKSNNSPIIAMDVVGQSMANNYAGLFAINENNQYRRKGPTKFISNWK